MSHTYPYQNRTKQQKITFFVAKNMEHFQEGEVKTPKKTINGSWQVRILQMDADFRACTWRKDMVNTCKRPGYHKARGLSLALEVNHQFPFDDKPLLEKNGETRKPTLKNGAYFQGRSVGFREGSHQAF